MMPIFNSSRPRQNGCDFAEDNFKCIFMNGNIWISIEILVKFAPKDLINGRLWLVQIMVWRQAGENNIIWTNDALFSDAKNASMS